MSVYKMDADYNADGSVLKDPTENFPSRVQVATSDSFAELRLSRHGFSQVIEAVSSSVEDSKPSERCVDGGTFSLSAAHHDQEDDWEVEIHQGSLQHKFLLSQNELEGFERLLKAVHPEHEVDPSEDPNLEVDA